VIAPHPRSGLLAPLVFLAATAPFLPALQAGFVGWDDGPNLVDNPHFRGLGWTQLRWMFTTTLLGHYIPLTWLSFALTHALAGMAPFAYHLGNLLLHGANAAVFFLVGRRLLGAAFGVPRPAVPGPTVEWGAALAALVFAVHPLRAESVAWATERRDLLSGLFYLLAVLVYLRGVQDQGVLAGRWRALCLLAFGAGLLSKSIVMTLPLTLLLLDVYPLRRPAGWRALLREKAGHLVLAAAGAAVALWAVHSVSGLTGYDRYGPPARLAMTAYSLWFYPARFVWPAELSPLYELPPVVRLADPRFAGPAIGVVVLAVLLLALRRRWPGGLAAWLHSAIALGPVAGLVHAGHQLAHDRYSYLSGLGFALLAGGALAAGLRGAVGPRRLAWLRPAAALTAAVIIGGLGAGAWRQTGIWRDSVSLWRAAVAADPTCGLCAEHLAIALVETGSGGAGRTAEAEDLLRRAIALRPDRPRPYYNLAALLVGQRRFAEAERVLQSYRRAFPGLADAPLRLGMLERDRGRPEAALPHLREALRLDPGSTRARAELADAEAAVAAPASGRDRAGPPPASRARTPR
jgi:tetratricopeptide (TPR) repeat protein